MFFSIPNPASNLRTPDFYGFILKSPYQCDNKKKITSQMKLSNKIGKIKKNRFDIFEKVTYAH
jgi:hypothetical protein